MVEPNENFVIFLTLFVFSFSLPKFLLLFGSKLLFMLFILLATFPVLSSKIKLHMSSFLGHLQTITTFAPSILHVFFFFSHMSITSLCFGLDFVVFLAMAKLKRGISCNVVFWEHRSFVELSHFHSFLSTSSVLDLFPNEPHIPSIVTPDPLINFSIQPPYIFDAFSRSPFNE